jgi:hypothetical protein
VHDAGRRPAAPPSRRRHDYAQLSQQVKRAGLLNRRTGYYAAKMGLTGGGAAPRRQRQGAGPRWHPERLAGGAPAPRPRVGYLTAVLLVLPPARAIVFILVQQGLFGLYLGLSFAPNHKGMAMPTDRGELDYLQRQVLTSRPTARARVLPGPRPALCRVRRPALLRAGTWPPRPGRRTATTDLGSGSGGRAEASPARCGGHTVEPIRAIMTRMGPVAWTTGIEDDVRMT